MKRPDHVSFFFVLSLFMFSLSSCSVYSAHPVNPSRRMEDPDDILKYIVSYSEIAVVLCLIMNENTIVKAISLIYIH